MRRAWTFRRFLLPFAGTVCFAGLSVAAEYYSPPKPPPDVVELNHSSSRSLRPTRIVQAATGPVLTEANDDAGNPAQPVLADPLHPEPIDALPIQPNPAALLGPDPQPVILYDQPQLPAPPLPEPVQPLPPLPAGPGSELYCDASCTTPMQVTENGCGSNCYCTYVPNWTIRGEALIWDRVGGGGVALVGAPVALNSSDLDIAWRAGFRVAAIRHGIFDSCWDLEVAYFGIDGWSATQLLADADNFLTLPPIFVGGVVPNTVTYTSSLHSFEVNGRRAYSEYASWFVGFRALQIDEQLASDFGGVATFSTSTLNQLYGAQLGLDVQFWEGPCWYMNAVGKAGIFGNSADVTTTTAGVGGALPLIALTGNQTSFVGELGLNANYRYSERFTLIAGYNLLWVTGVALAPDQLAAVNIATGAGAPDTNGSLFYHGVNLGAQYTW